MPQSISDYRRDHTEKKWENNSHTGYCNTQSQAFSWRAGSDRWGQYPKGLGIRQNEWQELEVTEGFLKWKWQQVQCFWIYWTLPARTRNAPEVSLCNRHNLSLCHLHKITEFMSELNTYQDWEIHMHVHECALQLKTLRTAEFRHCLHYTVFETCSIICLDSET